MNLSPVILEGKQVRLEPLAESHVAGLSAAGLHEELWRLIPFRIQSEEEMQFAVRDMLAAQAAGSSVPFATVNRADGQVVGATRFMNIDVPNRRVEIGGTWITPAFQRTAINTEAKYLMMRHAFEVMGCVRVELKTDALNEKSRNAILRIGAKEEGTLRKHVLTWSGRWRDSVYFSVLDTEWPQVKADLERKMER